MKSFLDAAGHHFRSATPRCPYPGCTAEVRPTAMDPSTDGDKPSFKHLPKLADAPLEAPLPASSPVPAATPTVKHSIRWWAVVDGERVRRKSDMKDSEHVWEATCSCEWESPWSGTMADVDKLVQEHKS